MDRKTMAELENSKGFVKSLEALVEVLVLTAVYAPVWCWYCGRYLASHYGNRYFPVLLYGVLTAVVQGHGEGFSFGNLRRFSLCVAQWISLAVVNGITWIQISLMANTPVPVLPLILLTAVQAVPVLGFVYLYSALYYRLYAPHTMIMVFGHEEAVGLKFKMDTRRDKYKIKKMISTDLGLERVCREIVGYDCVLINDVPARIRNDILKFCYRNRIRTYIVPKISDILMRGAADINVLDTPIVMVKGTGLSLVDRVAKRGLDLVLCLIALALTFPVMLAVAAAIRLEDGGPVFFRQKRATIGGKEFEILKFRSMIVDAEKDGISIPATGDDPRITRVGRFIRATRIDELPQILNILKGDMSVVGPRPERLEHMTEYSGEIPEFEYRLKVKGGLTGYAQIYGKYNTSPYDKLRLDLMYIENYSLLLDLKLILLTLRILFSKESTEGFEKVEELEAMKKEALAQVAEEAGRKPEKEE